ncbi:MAG: FAD:protein FMN transferase [Thermoleophilia bacterium]
MTPAVATAHLRALGTGAVVCVTDPAALTAARDALRRVTAEFDAACSRFRTDSELQRLNGAAGRRTPVGPLLCAAIRVALDAARDTGGAVDPTVGGAVRRAGYDRTFRRVADLGRAPVAFRPAPGWGAVELDDGAGTVRMPAGTLLDLGATAKALAADRAADAAREAAGCGVLVSLGGDIAVAGPPPPGGWSVLIADDHAADPASAGPVVSIGEGGLATSGTAVRRWRAGGREMHHLIDPRTGAPAGTAWRIVSVAAGSCVAANTASTAAMVMGDGAPEWLTGRGLPARLAAHDGGVVTVCGWPEDPR